MMRPHRFFLVFCFFATASNSFPQNIAQSTRTVTGLVRDAQALKPLPGASILLVGTSRGTTCDSTGRFKLNLPTTQLFLQVQHIGYSFVRLTLHAASRDTLLLVALTPANLTLPLVEVEAEREPRLATSVRVHARDLHDLPASSNDALTALKILPAVTSNNEMSSGFSVQGGSPEENLILLEGVELSRPQRVRSSTQENFSPLNSMMVSSLNFHAAGFPLRYGERLSSVLLARYRAEGSRKFGGSAELSLMNAGLMLEGQPQSRWHWVLGLRLADRSLLLRTLQTEGEFQPRAYDAQAVVHYKISARHQLLALGLYGNNAFRSQPREQRVNEQTGLNSFVAYRTTFTGYEDFSHRLALLSLQLTSQFSSRLSLWQSAALTQSNEQEDVNKTVAIASGPVEYLTGKILYLEPLSAQTLQRDNSFREHTRQYHAWLRFMRDDRSEFEAGVRLEEKAGRDVQREAAQTQKPNAPAESRQRHEQGASTARFFAVFGNYALQINSALRMETGVRGSYYATSSEMIWQPRMRMTFNLDESTKLSAAWGRYAQPASYWERRASAAFPRDEVPAQQATHYVLGLQQQRNDEHEVNVQAFYKRLAHYIPYRFEDTLLRFEPESEATARVYGGSVYFKLRISPRWTSWLAYTYLDGRQEVVGEGKSRLPTDQRHTLVALLQDEMPQIAGSRLHVRAILGSGYPFAPAPTNFSATAAVETLPRDALRYGRYRRIDVGVSYTLAPLPNVEGRLSCEIFNVFDFRNLLTYSAFEDAQGQLRFARVNLSGRWFNVKLNVEF